MSAGISPVAFLFACGLFLAGAYVVFRILVRRDYLRAGRLAAPTAGLELLVWAGFIAFPYLYNPPVWALFWSNEAPVGPTVRAVGVACTALGLLLAFGIMFWFGVRRALGLQVKGLITIGPYRWTRNPQLVAGWLMVLGTVILWPSWYAAAWAVLYGAIGHLMVFSEEEHLRRVFGEEYDLYFSRVPRYIGIGKRKEKH